MPPRPSVIVAAAAVAMVVAAQQSGVFSVLESAARIGRQPDGAYLLPTNQLLRPWGVQFPIAGRPVDLAFDPDARLLAVLNWRGVEIMDGSTGIRLHEVKLRSTSYTGIRFRPGSRELWVSEATRNGPDRLAVFELGANGAPGAPVYIDLPGHPVPSGLAFSADGKRVYCAFSRNNSLAVIDAGTRRLEREVNTGMAPFGVAVSARHGKIFVTNRAGRRPKPGETTAPSSGSLVLTDPRTGASATGTLTVVDARTYETREVEVGLAPSGLALSPDERALAVANGHSDTVSLIDAATLQRTDVRIPAFPESALGSQPIGVTFAPDGKRLYVACGGNNAVAILSPHGKGWKLEGAVPTAWFPSAIAIDKEGALRIVSIKGTGNTADGKGTFNSKQYEGSLSKIPPPLAPQIAAGTREVRAANSPRFAPAGGVTNLSSLGIEHVVLIVKENRTYDQVFGDMSKGNGDPKLTMYGRPITPNHHALAEKYVLLDNFHTGGAISFDGHHWLMQAFVSDYVERAFAASPRGYAFNLVDALVVSPAGFFWQHAPRPLDVRIYGEFCLPARWDPNTQSAVDMTGIDVRPWTEYWKAYKEGRWQAMVGCKPGVPALAPLMSPRFPNYSASIPDQIRAEEFLREVAEREKSGRMPHISVMMLNNDHTSGTRPGAPTPRAMVADNDLALGRIVEGLSKSRFWPKTLILVAEDDAQDGLDHVDGHRTVALMIGPRVRRGAVDSNHYNHTSMIRTIQEIFRIPPRTRFLAGARAMTSVFTPEADASPYKALTPEVALDEMNPPLEALEGRRLWAARESLKMDFRSPDDVPHETLNRILWWDAKGWNVEYPRLRR